MFYKKYLRKLLFALSGRDPEFAHESVLRLLRLAGKSKMMLRNLADGDYRPNDRLRVQALGLEFDSPIGLAAGFDKGAVALLALAALGWSFIEYGTVTMLGQPGNPRPRIFRLVEDEALINRLGFNGEGANVVAARRARATDPAIPLGASIGKSKLTDLKDAAADYLYSFRKLHDFADYFVVNVSSPNTPGLRKLQNKEALREILELLLEEANKIAAFRKVPRKKILVKLAPDLNFDEIDDVIDLIMELGLDGVIAVNTTKSRKGLKTQIEEEGGMSGRPLKNRALEVVNHIYHKTRGELLIIGVGGISCLEDVLDMLRAGATLIQIYTAFIYEGPFLAQRLKWELNEWLVEHKMTLAELRPVVIES